MNFFFFWLIVYLAMAFLFVGLIMMMRTTWHRFDGQNFLQKFRGQKIMFVGDSLSNNQWQSLACMLHFAVPSSNYTLVRSGGGALLNLSFPVGWQLTVERAI